MRKNLARGVVIERLFDYYDCMAAGTLNSLLQDEFTDINKALDVIEDRLPFIVDQAELGDALCRATELGHRADALQARIAHSCTVNKVPAVNGQRTVGQYVAARTNSRSFEIDRFTKTTKWLRDFPRLEAALGNELTLAHVEQLRKLDTNFDAHMKLRGDQRFFIDTAATCSFSGFLEACEYWRVHIDPDGKEPTEQIEKSRFKIKKGVGGRGEFTGQCDAVTADKLNTAINHEAEKIRQADKKNGIERTAGQRNTAALLALVERGFAREDGSFPVPLGNIVMSLEVAQWALATLAGCEPGDRVPVHPTDVDGRCELIDGTPIHPFLAVQALGLITADGALHPANLRRYVMEADSRVLDVSVNARSFPEWMRTAAHVQSRGQCETKGCDAPHHWLQIDHVQPVHHDGETRFDNAEPLCAPDNQAKGASPNQTPRRTQPSPPRRVRRTSAPADDDPDAASSNNVF